MNLASSVRVELLSSYWSAVFRKSRLLLLFVILVCSPLLTSCDEFSSQSTHHLRFGNPSEASSNLQNEENYLLVKPQYALSYNRKLKRANWVSWELSPQWMGDAERQNDFRPDPDLPEEWDGATPRDYRGSGYDRGHLVPSADRNRTIADNSATFVMTNIIPQSPHNNQGPWRELEEDSRNWVESGKTLQIIAGGYGRQTRIGKGKVTPPNRVWKVILIKEPGAGPEDITENSVVVAVDMPNRPGIKDDNWTKYQVSVNEIEDKTGLNLLSAVDDSVQQKIEANINRNYPKER